MFKIPVIIIALYLAFARCSNTVCAGPAKLEDSLKVSIVPQSSYDRNVRWIGTRGQFYVVVKNQSDKPVTVWNEWCSWGYFALSFEAITPDGKRYDIKKKDRGWDANFPDPFVIQPGEYFVMPVRLSEEWQGFPNKQQKLKLRAHYKIIADEITHKSGPGSDVRDGEFMSDWIELTISD